MSSAAETLPRSVTFAAFEALDDETDARLELIDGQFLAQAAPSQAHQQIATNIVLALGTQLRGRHPCRVLIAGTAVAIDGAEGLNGPCPDALVTYEPQGPRVERPAIVVEVLSPSTAGIDLTRKLALYESCGAIRHYVVVWQDQRRVLNFVREPSGRLTATEVSEGGIAFDAPGGLTLALADVYAGVDL